jgi:hypothetical protein
MPAASGSGSRTRRSHPSTPYFGGDGTASALGIEAANYMPLAGARNTRLARWRIAAFRGGWTSALVPYRDWYTRTFATEIARRDAVRWPRDIAVIVDRLRRDGMTLGRLAKTVNPASVLIHEWHPRAASFDTMLPDWTPASPFLSLVQDAHALGFKVMGYVNSHCVNFGSPVFVRDGIDRFALTRRVASLSHAGDTPKTFANATRDEILYLDPLSPGWRRYHSDQMTAWRTACARPPRSSSSRSNAASPASTPATPRRAPPSTNSRSPRSCSSATTP